DFSVALNNDLSHVGIRPVEWDHFCFEGLVERAVRVEPCQAGVGAPVHAEERAAQNHLAIRLQSEREDRGTVRCAVTTMPADSASWIEARINTAVPVQPRDAVARKSAHVGKASADDDL